MCLTSLEKGKPAGGNCCSAAKSLSWEDKSDFCVLTVISSRSSASQPFWFVIQANPSPKVQVVTTFGTESDCLFSAWRCEIIFYFTRKHKWLCCIWHIMTFLLRLVTPRLENTALQCSLIYVFVYTVCVFFILYFVQTNSPEYSGHDRLGPQDM